MARFKKKEKQEKRSPPRLAMFLNLIISTKLHIEPGPFKVNRQHYQSPIPKDQKHQQKNKIK